jgi:hypothetical protein
MATREVNGVIYQVVGSEATVKSYNPSSLPTNVTILSTVQIPEGGSTYSVTTMALEAFYLAGQTCPLVSITFPSTITSLGGGGFNACSSLESVYFNSGSQLVEVALMCFADCASLATITLPPSVTTLGWGAFYNCSSLSYLAIPANTVNFNPGTFGVFFGTSTNITIEFLNPNTIPTLNSPFGVGVQQGTAIYNKTVTNGLAQLSEYFTNVVMTCFLEGTKILTNNGYKKIEDLEKGDLVKTSLNDYKKVEMIGSKNIWNPALEDRVRDQLYVYRKAGEVFEDLVLTGCHSVLVDNFASEEEKEKTKELLGANYVTEKKYRLPACLDKKSKVYEKEGLHTIYNLALENDNYYNNYGIYANGLLVESCSKRYMKELSGMVLKE